MRKRRQAHLWLNDIKAGRPISKIATAENIHLADVSRILPLAFLVPKSVTDILDGNYPVEPTLRKLKCLYTPN